MLVTTRFAWGARGGAIPAQPEEEHHPTLVLQGAIVPLEVSGKRAAASIPGAKLVVVKGGPHGFNAAHAAEVNQALLAFLA